jgi:hypothetical protein
MKSKNILCAFLLICCCFSIKLFAQNFNLNIANEKYWYYRNRLYYFVKPGLKQGESNVASERNNVLQIIINNNDKLKHLAL